MRIFSTLLIVFLGCQIAAAQTATSSVTPDLNLEATFKNFTATDDDWTIYADEENKLYYIDFEKLKVNVNDIIVKNEAGEVLLKENVFNLPVNTIYELDFSHYKPGAYQIELRTFTGSITKKVSIP